MKSRMRMPALIVAVTALVAMMACGSLTTLGTAPAAAPPSQSLSAGTLDTLPVQQSTISGPAAGDSATVSADSLQAALIRVYELSGPGVVYLVTSQGSGSGFVYSQDGYIVTNNHVVAGNRNVEVVYDNGDRQAGEVVGSDPDSDLAVVKVDRLPEGVTPLALAQSDTLEVGQIVVAIGNPFGEQGSMSMGIISGLGRSLSSQRGTSSGGSTYSLPEVIQTDAPINPGNSGGPLLNLEGEVIGVNAAIATTTGANSGVGFSIPVSAVRLVVPSLIKDGAYTYPYIGASFDGDVTLEDQSTYGLSQTAGAYVLEVASGSPAERAGLVAADPTTGRGGDLIVAVDGQAIHDFSDLNGFLVFHAAVGQTVQLTVLRGGQQVTLALTLGARP